jgi:trk system potassium uptake protein TrkH
VKPTDWATAAERVRRLSGRIIQLPVPEHRRNTPNARDHALIFINAFALISVLGAVLLALPWTTESGRRTDVPDALFTSVSAMAGAFASVDTADHWNFAGELIILLLIQAGGLGFMVGASIVLQTLRRGLHSYSLRDTLMIRDGAPALSLGEAVDLSRRILRFTLITELIGALLLTIRFAAEMPLHNAVWQGVFYSVSSFCNAGFDLTGGFRSLVPYQSSLWINVVVIVLAQLGALSYVVIADVAAGRHWRAFSFETKLILSLNFLLVGIGAIAFLGSEWNGAMTGLGPGTKVLASIFQSVSTRSAGFATVDLSQVNDFTLFVFVGLMFLGGAPGSTAGGVKLTTFGVVAIAVLTALRGREEPQMFGRRIPTALVFRAMAVIALMAAALFAGTLLLVITEEIFGDKQGFLKLLFEATSALGSDGLSTGITPMLSTAGKFVLCGVLFFGKVGPLTVAYALQRRQEDVRYRFPEATVRIG